MPNLSNIYSQEKFETATLKLTRPLIIEMYSDPKPSQERSTELLYAIMKTADILSSSNWHKVIDMVNEIGRDKSFFNA